MNFGKGDKIKFLDEAGEGVIVSLSGDVAVVVTADGFEISYHVSKLVHADFEKAEQKTILHNTNFPEGVYLLFVPEDENKLLECALDVFLVNHTKYDIYFSFSYKYQADFVAMQSGGAGQGSVTELDTIQREELEHYSTVKVDLIFFSKMPYAPVEPVSEIIKLKAVKFYKETSYVHNPLVDRKAHAEKVVLMKEKEKEEENIDAEELKKFLKEKKDKGPKFSKSHAEGMAKLEMEIDLHLEEILDNEKGMNNSQKLDYQLNYFRDKLEEAIASNIKKIVFIHGIGNGRLKSEIRKALDTYSNVTYSDASYKRYGFGATEIIIR